MAFTPFPTVTLPFIKKSGGLFSQTVLECQDHLFANALVHALNGFKQPISEFEVSTDPIKDFAGARASAIKHTIPQHLLSYTSIKPDDFQNIASIMLGLSTHRVSELVGIVDDPVLESILDRILPRLPLYVPRDDAVPCAVSETFFFMLTGQNLTYEQRLAFTALMKSQHETPGWFGNKDVENLEIIKHAFAGSVRVSPMLKQLSYYLKSTYSDLPEDEYWKACTLVFVYLFTNILVSITQKTLNMLWDEFTVPNHLVLYRYNPKDAENKKFDLSFRLSYVMECARLGGNTFIPVQFVVDQTIVNLIQKIIQQNQIQNVEYLPQIGDLIYIDLGKINKQAPLPNVFTTHFAYPFYDVERVDPLRTELDNIVWFQPLSWLIAKSQITNVVTKLKNKPNLTKEESEIYQTFDDRLTKIDAVYKAQHDETQHHHHQMNNGGNVNSIPTRRGHVYPPLGVELVSFAAFKFSPKTVVDRPMYNNNDNEQNDNDGIDNRKLMEESEEYLVKDAVNILKQQFVIDSCNQLYKTLDKTTKTYGDLASAQILPSNDAQPHGRDQVAPTNHPVNTHVSHITDLLMGEWDEDVSSFGMNTNVVLPLVINLGLPAYEFFVPYKEDRTTIFKSANHGLWYRLLNFKGLPIPNLNIFASAYESLLLANNNALKEYSAENSMRMWKKVRPPQSYAEVLNNDALITELAFFAMPATYTKQLDFAQLKDTIQNDLKMTPKDEIKTTGLFGLGGTIPPTPIYAPFDPYAAQRGVDGKRTFRDVGLIHPDEKFDDYDNAEDFMSLFSQDELGHCGKVNSGNTRKLLRLEDYYNNNGNNNNEQQRQNYSLALNSNCWYIHDMTIPQGFAVRHGHYRYGALVLFDSLRRPIAIYVSHLNRFIPNPIYLYTSGGHAAQKLWNYAKWVWKTTFFMVITVRDHLTWTHLIEANSASVSTRHILPFNNTLRSVYKPFSWSTININNLAEIALYAPRGFVERTWGYDIDTISTIMRTFVETYKLTPAPERIAKTMQHDSPQVQSYIYTADPTVGGYNSSKQVDYDYQTEMFYILNAKKLNTTTKKMKELIEFGMNEWINKNLNGAQPFEVPTQQIIVTVPNDIETLKLYKPYKDDLYHTNAAGQIVHEYPQPNQTTEPINIFNLQELRQKIEVMIKTRDAAATLPPSIFTPDVASKVPIVQRAMYYNVLGAGSYTRKNNNNKTTTTNNGDKNNTNIDTSQFDSAIAPLNELVNVNSNDNNAGIIENTSSNNNQQIAINNDNDNNNTSPLIITTTTTLLQTQNIINSHWDRVYPLAYDTSRYWSIVMRFIEKMYDLLCLSKPTNKDNLFDGSIDVTHLIPLHLSKDKSAIDKEIEKMCNIDNKTGVVRGGCPYTKWFNYLQLKMYSGKSTLEDGKTFNNLADPSTTWTADIDTDYKDNLPLRNKLKFVIFITQLLVNGTSTHELIGTISDYVTNPTMIGVKLSPEQMIQDYPLQSVQEYSQLLLLVSFTGMKQPELLTDSPQLFYNNPYINNFESTQPDCQKRDPLLELHYINWLIFKYELLNWMVECDHRNLFYRDYPMLVCNPRQLEGSVSI